jgi:hypothetical protein
MQTPTRNQYPILLKDSTNNYSDAIESGKNRYPQNTDAIASKNTTAPPKGKSSLPEGFTPNDEDRALANKLGVDIEDARERFAYYHQGKGDRMADWHASFKGWLMNAPKFNRQRSTQPATIGSFDDNYADMIARNQ